MGGSVLDGWMGGGVSCCAGHHLVSGDRIVSTTLLSDTAAAANILNVFYPLSEVWLLNHLNEIGNGGHC